MNTIKKEFIQCLWLFKVEPVIVTECDKCYKFKISAVNFMSKKILNHKSPIQCRFHLLTIKSFKMT
jgi:hypothetical protein